MQDKINQDCACVAHSVGGPRGHAFLCVYDGHGQSGHDVSLEALFSVHEELERRPELLLREPAQAFEESFDAVQEREGPRGGRRQQLFRGGRGRRDRVGRVCARRPPPRLEALGGERG